MYYGRRLVSTGFQSCSEIFQPFLGNCWKYLIDSSVYSCVLQAIFNIFTRIFVFWILKKYKSWLLFSRDLSMYICNMINRCAPHEKKKRRNQEKNGNSRRSMLLFSPYRNREGYKFRKVMGDICWHYRANNSWTETCFWGEFTLLFNANIFIALFCCGAMWYCWMQRMSNCTKLLLYKMRTYCASYHYIVGHS